MYVLNVMIMAVLFGSRLTTSNSSRTAKLVKCLEQGGERLKDEAIGLRKPCLKS